MKRALRRTRRRAPIARQAAAFGALLAAASSSAGLSARDAGRVQALTVGPSGALAACEGLDASNSNQARSNFPSAPVVRRRLRIAGGIGQAPACDAAGDLIIAHGEPRLSKLDARGQSLWSERLTSEASSSPVLLNDGSILIVTHDGEAALFRATGELRHTQSLPVSNHARHHVAAIPRASGGAVLAVGSDVLWLDGRGELERRARARGAVTTIAESSGTTFVVSDNGAVESARASGDLELVGTLGGGAPDGAALRAGRLSAVVDGHRLVALDVGSGRVSVLAVEPSLELSGPLALFGDFGSALVIDGGFVSVRAEGRESARVSVTGGAFDPAARALRAALLIDDRAGTLAATRAGSDALFVRPDGSVARIADSACLDPFRPTPTPTGLAFSCRSGQLLLIGG